MKLVSPPRTQNLVNAGLLYDATAYHNSTEVLQIFPTLRRSRQKETNTTRIFMQDRVPISSQHESSQLQELTPPTCSLITQRLYIRHRFIVFHCNTRIRRLLDLYRSDLDSSYHVSGKNSNPNSGCLLDDSVFHPELTQCYTLLLHTFNYFVYSTIVLYLFVLLYANFDKCFILPIVHLLQCYAFYC
jgi:hypothetical protein